MNPRVTFLSQEKIAQARLSFGQLVINGPEDGDRFFEAFGPGNTTQVVERPFEKFEDYELLLSIIQEDNPQKFEQIHKGTPYYFMGWLSFDLKNYEKAVFYMDSAIVEDIRKDPIGWQNNPGNQFLTLSDNSQIAERMTKRLKELVESELTRFNSISNLSQLILTDFINKFILVLASDTNKHSIITALYSFILEFEDREKELQLRSSSGGSIEPALKYLFKGGLIFESLLKHLYPNQDNGRPCGTLGNVFHTGTFQADFLSRVQIRAVSLRSIVNAIGNNNDIQTAFDTVSRLRNTTGHNLVWDDIFNNPANFEKLYNQQINALLYLIHKKFI